MSTAPMIRAGALPEVITSAQAARYGAKRATNSLDLGSGGESVERGVLKKQPDSPAKIQEAATQFEALLINEMLQSARASGGTGITDDPDADSADSSLIELGEQQFSQALASSGGLGIAKMIISGLESHANR